MPVDGETDNEMEEDERLPPEKPPPTRPVAEESTLRDLVEKHMKCPKCGCGMDLVTQTKGTAIATDFLGLQVRQVFAH